MIARNKIKKLGRAFADEISASNSKKARKDRDLEAFSWQEAIFTHDQDFLQIKNISSWRLIFFQIAGILVFFIFLGRLWQLQVIEGKINLSYSEGNRIQTKIVNAPRGIIFDRNKTPLVRNVPAFRKVVEGKTVALTRAEALSLEGDGDELSWELEIDSIRSYLYPEITAHILGYTSQISRNELSKVSSCAKSAGSNCQYRASDRVGRSGIEETYESYLRGIPGKVLTEVDSGQLPQRILAKIEPQPGYNLILTIDLELQKVMVAALKEQIEKKAGVKAGVVLAQNPKTGEILGLVSLPSFDTNILNKEITQKEFDKLANSLDQPMLNRAIAGTYPPGSTFKIITALAGLETGKINKNTKIEDTGEMFLGQFRFPNWYFIQYGKTEGVLDLVGALRRSNDIFFYQAGQWLGEEVLSQFSRLLGIGQTQGIDLPGEISGLAPDFEWKQKIKGEPWYPGDTLHMAIGQGDLLVTPLEILSLTSFTANGGTFYKPYLASRVINDREEVVKTFKPVIMKNKLVKAENLNLVREGMKEACEEGGTGWPFFDFLIPVACKTGTAEFGEVDKAGQSRTHAWFTSFAPFDNPQITVTVLVEGGGEGSSVAGPVARKIYEYYFKDELRSMKEKQ